MNFTVYLFPRGWIGFAVAQLPLGIGSLNVLLPVWIGGNAVAALWLCEWLLMHNGFSMTRLYQVGSAAVAGLYMLLNEGKPSLAFVAGAAWWATIAGH